MIANTVTSRLAAWSNNRTSEILNIMQQPTGSHCYSNLCTTLKKPTHAQIYYHVRAAACNSLSLNIIITLGRLLQTFCASCPSILCRYELHRGWGECQPQNGGEVLLDDKLSPKGPVRAHLEPLHRSPSILLSSSQENKKPTLKPPI